MKPNNVKRYNGNLNVISDTLRMYREEQKLSYSQLSNKLQLIGIDIPKSSLENIESNKRIVKEYELYAICKVLNVSIDDMLKNFIKNLDY